MKTTSVLLRGEVGSDLVYPLSLIEDVLDGRWEMCVSTIGFTYTTPAPTQHLAISSNYVMGKFVSGTSPSAGQTILNLCIFGNRTAGAKTIIGMKQQTYFPVNNAQQFLRVTLKNAETGERPSGANVIALILLRRVA